MNGMPGVNSTADVNVHSLACRSPIDAAHPVHCRAGPADPAAVIGVWTTASRQRVRVRGNGRTDGRRSAAARGPRCRASATR